MASRRNFKKNSGSVGSNNLLPEGRRELNATARGRAWYSTESLLMPIREIAIAIILDAQGHYLFQRRDDIPGIAHPGKVSLFGGHREAGETYLQCVVREVQEEIGYPVLPEDAEYLTNLDGAGDIVDGDLVRGEVFVLRGVPSGNLVVTEGSLTIVEPDRLVELEPEFTPATRHAFGAFLGTSQS